MLRSPYILGKPLISEREKPTDIIIDGQRRQRYTFYQCILYKKWAFHIFYFQPSHHDKEAMPSYGFILYENGDIVSPLKDSRFQGDHVPAEFKGKAWVDCSFETLKALALFINSANI